ncbi:alpha/beta hydrolase [Microbacterium sp. LRZ72]|uniref:alpha/beta hydrolase n=1 Tax=Microbacterium sp. LRZ72 TaxID=2942481 RepID=UPI0029A851E6|nr:alpha/beta hydrolase [Microbacterium sp. LRZ72]MDX2377097.1 alpha/beta hydrolase [Microbacterium sp. LRZ72]
MTSVRTEPDVAYARAGGRDLRCDLHWPADAAGPLPVAIYLHGGGWARGSRSDRASERLIPVAASGIAVASIEYRLSGEAVWPAQFDDVRAALAAVPALLADRGVAVSGRVSLWGCSAGGHVALMAALTAVDDQRPDAVVAWFPPTDLTLMSRAPASPGARMPSFLPPGVEVPAFERMLLGLPDESAGASSDAEALRAASPLALVRAGSAPVLLIHGDEDALMPASHSEALHDALRDAGGDVSMLTVRGATHEDPLFDTPAVLGATAAHLRGGA